MFGVIRMRFFIFVVVLLLFPVKAFPEDLLVPTNYPTIQQAINMAASGDRILVAPGTYMEHLEH